MSKGGWRRVRRRSTVLVEFHLNDDVDDNDADLAKAQFIKLLKYLAWMYDERVLKRPREWWGFTVLASSLDTADFERAIAEAEISEQLSFDACQNADAARTMANAIGPLFGPDDDYNLDPQRVVEAIDMARLLLNTPEKCDG